MVSTLDRVEELLTDVDYPAHKETLLAEAERHGGEGDALRVLRALPPVEYGSRAEVLRSIDLDPAENAGQTASEKGRQTLEDTHPRRAEHLTEVEASSIEQEVGFNKGS